MGLVERLIVWLGGFVRPRHLAEHVEDDPDVLLTRRVYLIGEGEAPWAAALVCPCGCGAVIKLSLLPTDSPRWSADVDIDGAVTLRPSVWRTKGCRSHFVLWRGRIIWAKHLARHSHSIDLRHPPQLVRPGTAPRGDLEGQSGDRI